MVMARKYTERLVVSLPIGSYRAGWVDPAWGAMIRTKTFEHRGRRTLETPEHAVDIAVRLKVVGSK